MMVINLKHRYIMKKYINKIVFLLTFSALLMSCEKDDVVVINEDFSTTVGLDTEAVILEEGKAGEKALKVTWTTPEFGFNAAAEYNILFDVGENFESPQTVSAGDEMEGDIFVKIFTHEQLNKIAINLGAAPGVETPMFVKVDIVLSKQYEPKGSQSSSFMATAYADVLDLTSPWGIVGDATPIGWPDGNTPDALFYKTDEAGVFVTYINLKVGEWKIRKDNSWDLNYGSDNNDGTLQENGGNIPVTEAGSYKVTFDENNLTYAVENYSWGLVGDATEFGWDKPDVPLVYDPCSDTWRAARVELKDGKLKIRQNEAWDVNYGSDAGDGNLQQNGADIEVAAGVYEVIVDFNNLTYSIEQTDVWGVVGSATPNGWDGPDVPFTPDYCNEGIFYANGVTLVEGAIKFRTNNVWVDDYGDKELDNILDKEGGNDIPISEGGVYEPGVYDIVLDFSNSSVPTYTMTKK
jgi:hypothetical protein